MVLLLVLVESGSSPRSATGNVGCLGEACLMGSGERIASGVMYSFVLLLVLRVSSLDEVSVLGHDTPGGVYIGMNSGEVVLGGSAISGTGG